MRAVLSQATSPRPWRVPNTGASIQGRGFLSRDATRAVLSRATSPRPWHLPKTGAITKGRGFPSRDAMRAALSQATSPRPWSMPKTGATSKDRGFVSRDAMRAAISRLNPRPQIVSFVQATKQRSSTHPNVTVAHLQSIHLFHALLRPSPIPLALPG